MKTHLLISAVFLALFLGACASGEKMLDQGNYDQLIQWAQKKLNGKKKNREKYVGLLEEAFKRIQQQDMARIRVLRDRNRPSDWDKILQLTREIEVRQGHLSPFLPLIDEYGYKANFEFIKTVVIENDVRQIAAEYYYADGLAKLEHARNAAQKATARSAYFALKKADRYLDNFNHLDTLLREAHARGIIRVLVDLDNDTDQPLPPSLAEEIFDPQIFSERDFWVHYYHSAPTSLEFDYRAKFKLLDIQVHPETIHDREISESKKVSDGWDYVLDKKGNVKKDSLGNDIKTERFVRVRATVIETHQEKSAALLGRLQVWDLRTNAMIESVPVRADAHFQHLARTFFGDERALSKHQRQVVLPAPFPSDVEMLLMAADVLKPKVKEHLKGFRLG